MKQESIHVYQTKGSFSQFILNFIFTLRITFFCCCKKLINFELPKQVKGATHITSIQQTK